MASSGVATFSLSISDIIEKAYERCGIELRSGWDAQSARTALNLLSIDWINDGIPLWTVTRREITLVQGTKVYSLAAGEIDVIGLAIRTSGNSDTDIVIERMSRLDDLYIPDKDSQGRPTQYYVDRQLTPTINFWPVPDATARTAVVDVFSYIEAVTSSPEDHNSPQRFLPALIAGAAYYIAQDKPKLVSAARRMELKGMYEEAYRKARSADSATDSFQVRPYVRRII